MGAVRILLQVLRRAPDDIARGLELQALQDRNETLFFRLLIVSETVVVPCRALFAQLMTVQAALRGVWRTHLPFFCFPYAFFRSHRACRTTWKSLRHACTRPLW
jgi:hypothetical protein